jgi:hypothetical protein
MTVFIQEDLSVKVLRDGRKTAKGYKWRTGLRTYDNIDVFYDSISKDNWNINVKGPESDIQENITQESSRAEVNQITSFVYDTIPGEMYYIANSNHRYVIVILEDFKGANRVCIINSTEKNHIGKIITSLSLFMFIFKCSMDGLRKIRVNNSGEDYIISSENVTNSFHIKLKMLMK